MDDFSEYPMSLGEKRAAKQHDAGKWTVRDALIAALRDIDSGRFDPQHCVLAFAIIEGSNTQVETFNCFPSSFYAVGLLQAASKQMLE
jgi:hypothetical protein